MYMHIVPEEFTQQEWKLGPHYQGKWIIYIGPGIGPSICHAFSKEIAEYIIQCHNERLKAKV